MNAVDIGILVIVGLFAVEGLRRGFILGVIDLIAFGLSVLAAARFSEIVAAPLRDRGIPPSLAASMGFVVAAVVSFALIGFAARLLLSAQSPRSRHRGGLGEWDPGSVAWGPTRSGDGHVAAVFPFGAPSRDRHARELGRITSGAPTLDDRPASLARRVDMGGHRSALARGALSGRQSEVIVRWHEVDADCWTALC